ncbi:MAG TPA: hypothetical protein PLL33_12605, partial [Paracoccus sp. (in: a-proteobacteria)]|nr:hypothetical protein [Paracoccus sp. (in: a-proteobacteria)]
MAGFWTGLAQGTLLCGATLAALSLAAPLPRGADSETTQKDRAALVPEPLGDAAVPPVPAEEAAPSAQKNSGTAAVREPAGDVPDPIPPVPPPIPGKTSPYSGQGTQDGAAAVPPPLADLPDAAASVVADGPAPSGPLPAAEHLPDPVGSEFRRGDDTAPDAPAPLTA